VFVVIQAFGLGFLITHGAKKLFHKGTGQDEYNWLQKIGLYLLVGLGAIGYIGIIVGFLGVFNKRFFLVLGALLFLNGLYWLYRFFARSGKEMRRSVLVLLRDPIALPMSLVICAVLGSLYLSALLPPYASDELHYHLSEVRLIVNTGRYFLSLGDHLFYGNIPKLMEVIYAYAVTLHGIGLSHLLHLAFFVAGLLVVSGTVANYYGRRAGALSVLFLVFYNEITWNSTVGFIDAATVSLEVSSLLFALDWFVKKREASLLYSAILIGLAASMKYSVLTTMAFIIGLIFLRAILDKKDRRLNLARALLPFVALLTVFGGFYYIKNLAFHGNPFYPLYLGHKGYDELAYKGLINAIQEFGPRTLSAFLQSPNSFLYFDQIFIWFAFFLGPLVFLINRKKKFHIILLGYFGLYWPYWFFLATHQYRFLMPAIVVLLIMTAIFLTQLRARHLIVTLATIFIAFIGINRYIKPIYSETSIKNFVDSMIIRQNKIPYALGRESEVSFLSSQFGCQYNIIDWLAKNKLEGNVIDNWSVWHDPSVSSLAKFNTFTSFKSATNDYSSVGSQLDGNNIKYLYFKTTTKARHLANPDPEVIRYRAGRAETEGYLLERSELVYESAACQLYKIDRSLF